MGDTHSKSKYQNQTIRSQPFGPYHSRIIPKYCRKKLQGHCQNNPNFPSRNKISPTILNPKKTASWETAERQMTMRKVCRSRGGEETWKNTNNMRNREGRTKERELGSEAYSRYTTNTKRPSM
jgi:hypothetical protein